MRSVTQGTSNPDASRAGFEWGFAAKYVNIKNNPFPFPFPSGILLQKRGAVVGLLARRVRVRDNVSAWRRHGDG